MNAQPCYPIPLVSSSTYGGGALPSDPDFRPITVREVEEIIALTDPVQRNLRITQAYHELKIGMTYLLGRDNVSWCAFATWASRTAGRFIRGEYVPSIVQGYMDKLELFHRGIHVLHRLLTGMRRDEHPPHSVLWGAVERVTRVVTENVGWGNHLVFEDMAPLYARMLEEFMGATTYDQRAIDRFVSVLRPGPVEEGGQDLLMSAFRNYYKAMFDPDRKTRAELILLANNQVGYHEQTRLQDPIVNSLNAPIADLIVRAAQDRAHALMHEKLHNAVDGLIDRLLRPLYTWLQREWAGVATRWLMRLELPNVTLSLGEDLPQRCEHLMFPQELMELENTELRALLYELDHTPNTTEGSGARNWGELADRMNFVVDFFRTRQQDHSLYRQPFTDAQVIIIRDGGIPEGDI